jgi:hypothetical protein
MTCTMGPLDRELVFRSVAEAIDSVPESHTALFLTKLVLLLGIKCADGDELRRILELAVRDL